MHALWKDRILTFSESQGVSCHELFLFGIRMRAIYNSSHPYEANFLPRWDWFRQVTRIVYIFGDMVALRIHNHNL